MTACGPLRLNDGDLNILVCAGDAVSKHKGCANIERKARWHQKQPRDVSHLTGVACVKTLPWVAVQTTFLVQGGVHQRSLQAGEYTCHKKLSWEVPATLSVWLSGSLWSAPACFAPLGFSASIKHLDRNGRERVRATWGTTSNAKTRPLG